MKTCSVEGCEGKCYARGFCHMHYLRNLRHGDPLFTLIEMGYGESCSVNGCQGKHKARGLCDKHYNIEYYAAPENKENHSRWRAEYYAKPKNRKRETEQQVERKHGITPTQYREVLKSQGNRCAICRSETTGNKRTTRFCIDHEHVEGYEEMLAFKKMRYFRGLLCHHCNTMLKEGFEDTETLQKLIDYLRNPPAKELGLKYKPDKTRSLRETLISEFGNGCRIDPSHRPGVAGVLSVDHYHMTKEVRGLLCNSCNAILGSARDSPEILESAIKYLEAYRGQYSRLDLNVQVK